MNQFFPLNTGKLLELKTSLDNDENCVVFFAQQTNRCHIASQLNRPFIYVVSDLVVAQQTVDILSQYCDKKVEIMPEREDVYIDRQVDNLNTVWDRVNILNELINGDIFGLVVTIDSLVQLYPSKQMFLSNTIKLEKNTEINIDNFINTLINMGYVRQSLVENVSSFSIRGDIVDIFPIGEASPYRIEFFGDTIENIKQLDLDSMLCNNEFEFLTILPSSDILVNYDMVESILRNVNKELRLNKQKVNEHIDNLVNNFRNKPSSALNTYFLPFISNNCDTIYSYLAPEAIVVFDDVKLIDDMLQLYQNSASSRLKELIKDNKALPIHKNSIYNKQTLYDISHTILGFGKITSQVPIFEPQKVYSIKTQNVPKFHLAITELYNNLKNYELSGFTVRLFAKDNERALVFQKNLQENMISVPISDTSRPISIEIGNIDYGFIYLNEKLVSIGIKDYSRPIILRKSLAQKKSTFILPEKGDYVVHDIHGIGISEGMQKVETTSGVKDFYVILYREGGRLYLPANQLNTIEKYNGLESPALHKLGGAEFERVKQRVKLSVKKMAFDLLNLYQTRFAQKGYKYPEDTQWQSDMENDFEYVPTDDQLIAINEIKQDIEQGKIMDRLLCGDVGFGKTEVAIRAIFKTVLENKQVVLLAPTTILAQQHYNLIRARFNKYDLNIALLSRFVHPKQQKEVLKQLESGTVNIVIATHRILSKDVHFFDLGLLVLDEEQRFGVEQKEKLKVFKNKVNILSLSATPIPRTLHMALSGIRDISTLEIPPKNRLPIQTYITEYNDNLLISAVQKEVNRGGKVFILYNRVATIEKWYDHIKSILPESIRIIMIHGQMQEDLLSRKISDFYEGKAEILLSTTIIENGIDLPDANTLFVLDADKLGLGQLYQLRGRVGRSNVLAYAYFTIKENKVLNEKARKRLDALMDNTDLGSGFKIAMRDLEIRGAGNVLGKEQHGQMGKVGYDMYLKLVQEGIDELKGLTSTHLQETRIIIDGDYYLDEDYIVTSRERVAFYKRVSLLSNREDARQYQNKLEETYGKLTPNVLNIIRLGLMKNLAKKLQIKKITISAKDTILEFVDNTAFTNEGLIGAISDYNKYALMVPSDPPTIVFSTKKLSQKSIIKLILDFLVLSNE
ncbi:MAG: transcription-repair coupling factor [Clostridia bacterium]